MLIFPVTCHTKFVGEGSAFVAIDGFNKCGIDFIPEAIVRGAKKIVFNKTCQQNC